MSSSAVVLLILVEESIVLVELDCKTGGAFLSLSENMETRFAGDWLDPSAERLLLLGRAD